MSDYFFVKGRSGNGHERSASGANAPPFAQAAFLSGNGLYFFPLKIKNLLKI